MVSFKSPSTPIGRVPPSVSPKIGTPSCAELGNHGGGRDAVPDRTPNRRMRMRRRRPLLFLLLAQLHWQHLGVPLPLLAGLKRAGRPPSAFRAGRGPLLVGFKCGLEGPPPHPELAHDQCVSPLVSFKLGWKALLHTHRPGAPFGKSQIGTPPCAELGHNVSRRGAEQHRTPNRRRRSAGADLPSVLF